MSFKLKSHHYAVAASLLMTISVGAQPVQLRVFDKVGNEVGPYDHGLVYVRLDESTLVAIQLSSLDVQGPRGWWQDNTRMTPQYRYDRAVYFTEADCAGTAYIFPYGDVPGVNPSAVMIDKNTNNVFVYIGKVGHSATRELHSRLTYQKHCENYGKQVVNNTVVPVVKVFDLTAQFPVPYSLK